MKSTRIISLLLFILINLYGLTQETNDTIFLPQVEVLSSKIVFQSNAMQRKTDTIIMKRFSTSNLSNLLIQSSPVFIKTYGPGGLATASFRGTTASHTLVLWNGLQLNAPSLGQVDFSTIPVFLADDLSLKWGSKTSSQSGGLGGIVSIDSKPSLNKGLSVNINQTIGSFNTFGTYATISYSNKKFQTKTKVFRASSNNDFEFLNTAIIPKQRMKQPNADYTDYGFIQEFHYLTKIGVFSIASWNQWNNRNLPPIMTNMNKGGKTEEYSRDKFSRNFLSFKTYWQGGELSVKSSYFIERQHYYLRTTTAISDETVSLIDAENNADIWREIAQIEQTIYKSWTISGKIQWDKENVKSNNYNEKKSRNTLSLFVSTKLNPLKNTELEITLRNDWIDGKSQEICPTFSFDYKMPFVKGLSIGLGLSKNYRSPSMNDLFWYPGGNKDLKAEIGKSIDLATDYQLSKNNLALDVHFGAYISNIKNWIQWKPTTYRYWVPENVAEVFARGFESHINVKYRIKKVTTSLSANYVFTKTTDESDNAAFYHNRGKQLIYIPKHHANLFANIEYHKWDFSYTAEFTGERNTSMNEDEFFAFKLPYYLLHHISIGKEIKQFRIELRINNLTNKDYQAILWRAMPGRSYEILFSFKI